LTFERVNGLLQLMRQLMTHVTDWVTTIATFYVMHSWQSICNDSCITSCVMSCITSHVMLHVRACVSGFGLSQKQYNATKNQRFFCNFETETKIAFLSAKKSNICKTIIESTIFQPRLCFVSSIFKRLKYIRRFQKTNKKSSWTSN
jgi:hypothetical protein